MTEHKSGKDKTARLRRLAEEGGGEDTTEIARTLSKQEQELVHELRVHQIELEMQNEELRRTQHELECSRARYFDLYDLAPVGYLTLSGKGVIREANLAAATMLGVERSALVGQPISRLILKEDQELYSLHRKELLESGGPQDCELRMVKSDKSAFWVHLAASIEQCSATNPGCCDEDEPVVRVVLSDISDRKQAEKSLNELNEELGKRVAERTEEIREKDQILILQSRQAAMGEMISNIAHQWRQPLNALGLIIQQLFLFYDMGEFDRAYLENRVSQAMDLILHMSRTIDDFKGYLRPDKEKADFKLQTVLAGTLSLMEDSFRNQDIAIEVSTKSDPVIFGYRNEYAQVLLNVLNNARDVLLERKIVGAKVTINIFTEGGRAVVTISDNAGGVPGEIMGKIFDPYFTTKGPQAGTGVGLFMSKTIIEKNMGGRLSVRNIGEGAEFRIEV